MRRFYLPEEKIIRGRFFIDDLKIAKHLRQVLRLHKGDIIELFDGKGNEYQAEIRFLTKEQVSGLIVGEKEVKEGYLALTLAQALPKAGKIDGILRACTEVGVSKFQLFDSEYGIAKAASYSKAKVDRLKRVVQEAARQSERKILPQVDEPVSFAELIKGTTSAVKVLLHARDVAGAKNLVEIKQELAADADLTLAIGPEGGFSPQELTLARAHGWQIAYLQLPVMRTETAGVVAAGLILAK